MLSIFLLIPLSLMLFVVAIWAVRYAVKSNQFEDLDNASQRIILDDRQERRQVMQAQENATATQEVKEAHDMTSIEEHSNKLNNVDIAANPLSDTDKNSKI
ncbi:MAG TPA: cbb3-type cytochrome oxidase assembly protein CcoS [Psychrobacter sp.]|nr:cbb3-type cytochrome oxidase assembly protein CcoS [Psychrobacter sp.]|tara:strand:+ start:349 stop:651 length:303 start_codon:yes stop_codon:yes gene_type:complete